LFQRYCLDHVNATLSEMGVLKGTTTEPFSEIWMGHKNGALTKPGNLPPFGDHGQQYPLGRKGVRLSDSDL
jgi:hypothetical protein